MKLWRRAAGVETWRHGALEARNRCSDVEVWETLYGCSDVEVWRRAVGVATWMYGCMKL